MKKIVSFLLIASFLFSTAKAQDKKTWKEMDEFHTVIGATFHPSEEGKLEPIKKRSGELLDKAIAWKNSTAPTGYDKKAVKKSLQQLVTGAKEINKMVQEKAADNELKKKLSELHDVFHTIMEKCEKEDHH